MVALGREPFQATHRPHLRIRIKGGRVIDPANGVDGVQDLLLAEGVVVGLGAHDGFTADREIDARGRIVCPGLVDVCARLREPGLEHKATIASETRAAAAGGITTLCHPPDTDPVIDTPAVVRLVHQRAAEAGLARVEVQGALTRGLQGTQLSEMGALGAAGCVGVGNALQPVRDATLMRRAMEYAATFDLTVFAYPEDPWLAAGGCVHEGALSTRLGLPGIPETAETVALARDILLAEQTGARVHFCHLSSARGVEMVRAAQARGLPVSADVTAHHLHLTDADVGEFDSQCHVRPPLRTQADRDGLRAGVADGTLGAICSDHQPHEIDAKLDPFTETEPGVTGLETLLSLALELVEQGVVDLGGALRALTAGPGHVLRRPCGTLSVGAPADVCVFDPEAHWVPAHDSLLSHGHNTPFLGRTLRARATHTLFTGRVVHEGAT
jgi:dihydroorotase